MRTDLQWMIRSPSIRYKRKPLASRHYPFHYARFARERPCPGECPWALSGRVGTPSDTNLVIGVSAFFGRMRFPTAVMRWRMGLMPPGGGGMPMGSAAEESLALRMIVERWRMGADVTQILGALTVAGELAAGQDFDQDVLNGLAEVRWARADQTLHAYLQIVYLGQRRFDGWDQDVMLRMGGVCKVGRYATISLQYTHDLATHGSRSADGKLGIQLRLYF